MTNATAKFLSPNEMSFTILKEISHKKRATFKEIRNLFNQPNGGVSSEALEQVLKQLEQAHLIGVVGSEYRDFNSYYLTAEGTQMARKLENFGALDRAFAAR